MSLAVEYTADIFNRIAKLRRNGAADDIHPVPLCELCEQGLFQNQRGTVTVLVSRQDYQARQSKQFVADTFSGSLPAFLAAFAQGAPLSQKDIADIRALIDRFEQEGQT